MNAPGALVTIAYLSGGALAYATAREDSYKTILQGV
jgi:hypothetical protein